MRPPLVHIRQVRQRTAACRAVLKKVRKKREPSCARCEAFPCDSIEPYEVIERAALVVQWAWGGERDQNGSGRRAFLPNFSSLNVHVQSLHYSDGDHFRATNSGPTQRSRFTNVWALTKTTAFSRNFFVFSFLARLWMFSVWLFRSRNSYLLSFRDSLSASLTAKLLRKIVLLEVRFKLLQMFTSLLDYSHLFASASVKFFIDKFVFETF